MANTTAVPVPSRDALTTSIMLPYDVTNATTYAMATDVTFANATEPYGDYFQGGLKLHPHWHQYMTQIENIPDAVFYALGLYIAFVGIIGVLGNFIVIYIFSTTRSLRTPPNMFVINLAVSDLAFSAINGFPLMTIASFQKRWMWGKLACTLYGYLGGIFGMNSINTLAWISIDRYYVISKPFHAMRNITHQRAALQLVVVWIWSILWVSPPLLGWGSYIAEGFQVECSFDYLSRDWATLIHNHGMFWCGFTMPVLIICYCYINIVLTVSTQGKAMNKTADKLGANTTKDERTRKRELQTAKVAACTISLFLLSWIPYAIVSQFGVYKMSNLVTPYTTQIPVLFAKASAMWNPIVYALSHPRFRAQLDERMPWLVCCSGRNMDKENEAPTNANKTGGRKPKKKLEHSSSVMSTMSDLDSDTDDTDAARDTKVHSKPSPNRTPQQDKVRAKLSPSSRPVPRKIVRRSGSTEPTAEKTGPVSNSQDISQNVQPEGNEHKTTTTPGSGISEDSTSTKQRVNVNDVSPLEHIPVTETSNGEQHDSPVPDVPEVKPHDEGKRVNTPPVTSAKANVNIDSKAKWRRLLSKKGNNNPPVDVGVVQNSDENPQNVDRKLTCGSQNEVQIPLKELQKTPHYKPTKDNASSTPDASRDEKENHMDTHSEQTVLDNDSDDKNVYETTDIDDVPPTTESAKTGGSSSASNNRDQEPENRTDTDISNTKVKVVTRQGSEYLPDFV